MTSPPRAEDESPWTRRRATWALLGIATLALVLRLVGIDFLLPHVWEPDQRVYTTQVDLLRRGVEHPERHVNFGWYPLLVARTVCLLPTAGSGAEPRTLDEHLDRASAPRRQIRTVLAVLSVLLVPATYFIARRFARRDAALVAALLVGVSTFHIWYAQETRPHGLATAAIACALAGALLVRARGDALAYLAAGVGLAFAVGTLQSGLAALPAILVAHLACRQGRFAVRSAWLLATLGIGFVAVRVFYPFVFQPSAGTDLDAAQFGVNDDAINLSGHRVFLEMFTGGGFQVLAHALWRYDPVIAVLGLAGVLFAAWSGIRAFARVRGGRRLAWIRVLLRRRADVIVLLGFAVPYLLVFGAYGRTYPRFALPFVPLLACVAAVVVVAGPARLGRTPRGCAILRTVGIAAVVLQAICAARLSWTRAQPDTARLAADWIEAHVDRKRERLAIQPGFDLPLFRDAASRADSTPFLGMQNFPWLKYQVEVAANATLEPAWSLRNIRLLTDESRALRERDPSAWVRSIAAEWVVIVRGYEGPSVDLEAAHVALTRECELAARFTPLAFDMGDDSPFVYQDDLQVEKPCLWWRILVARRSGPSIEIRRLPRG